MNNLKIGTIVKVISGGAGALGCMNVVGEIVGFDSKDITNGISYDNVCIKLEDGSVWGVQRYFDYEVIEFDGIRIDDEVRIIKNKQQERFNHYIGKTGIVKRISKSCGALYLELEGLDRLTRWEFDEVEKVVKPTSDLELEKIIKSKFEKTFNNTLEEKTNRIKRLDGDNRETIIEYDINNDKITFSVYGHPIGVLPLFRILLHETGLYDYTYERISPYKVSRVYSDVKESHQFGIQFIDVKDEYKLKGKMLIETDKNVRVIGKHTMFIPDFLELCVERSILRNNKNGFDVMKNLENSMKNCTYLTSKPSVGSLVKQGFKVPNKYKSL